MGFHGHMCPGQVLGARMTLAGCRKIGIERPRSAGKGLAVLIEIDREEFESRRRDLGAGADPLLCPRPASQPTIPASTPV